MKAAPELAPTLRDAARMVARVAAGRSLADELGRAADEAAPTARAALLDLTHGTLRRYGRVQAIVAALYEAHAEKKALDGEAIEREMKRTRPLSVVMAEKVAALRAWARERAVAAD